MTTSIYRRDGAVSFPATPGTVTTTLEPLDPGRDILLGLFKQAIESELGTAWNTARSGTVLASVAVVADTWPGQPTREVMLTRKASFPLLCVYRTGTATIEELTMDIERTVQPWSVDYILGPLPVEDQRRLLDVLGAIARVVKLVIRRRGHPDFDGGALQFFEGTGQFASVALKSFEIGSAPFGGEDQPLYHAISLTLETVETDGSVEGVDTALEGASFTFGLTGNEGTLPASVIVDTDTPVDDLKSPV